ncbi:MAG: IMP cyclohydrolase [Clostridia bacterium]|nr:IMP cyclohydrolase [Clostridia bacterium]
MNTLTQAVSQTTYPGRGIIAGKSSDGKKAVFAYFIMGRSENSRNRIFVMEDAGMRTKAYDEAKMKDPSLIIYWPVRKLENKLIVTNGDQTDTIYDYVKDGKSFIDALNTRCFEPDAPNFTPRISCMATFENGDFSLQMGVLKSANPEGSASLRCYYLYEAVKAGEGEFIHTYAADGNPLPSFTGEPEKVEIGNESVSEIAETIWNGLNEDNRVSLYVCITDLETLAMEEKIINRHA